MAPWTWLLLALLPGCQGCAGCRPASSDTWDDRETAEHDTGTADSGEAPCDVPEQEPNGSMDQATPLPLERQGCGRFGEPMDLDFWRFELDLDTWLAVRVQARSLGSFAHPSLLLSSDAGEQALVPYQAGQEDPALVFPAPADGYTLLLNDDVGQGDEEGYEYEVLAGQAKAPVGWNLEESEPDDDLEQAAPLASGDRVLGGLSDRWDQDWYRVGVPAGKHAVILDVDAWEHGSAGDFSLVVYAGDDPAEASVRERIRAGEGGWEVDPWAELTSAGDEDLWIQVAEQADRSGPAYWYVLAVTLEAS